MSLKWKECRSPEKHSEKTFGNNFVHPKSGSQKKEERNDKAKKGMNQKTRKHPGIRFRGDTLGVSFFCFLLLLLPSSSGFQCFALCFQSEEHALFRAGDISRTSRARKKIRFMIWSIPTMPHESDCFLICKNFILKLILSTFCSTNSRFLIFVFSKYIDHCPKELILLFDKDPNYLKVNPMKKVPAFTTSSGLRLFEASVIMAYLEDKYSSQVSFFGGGKRELTIQYK